MLDLLSNPNPASSSDPPQAPSQYPQITQTSQTQTARPLNKETARLEEIKEGMDVLAKESYLKRMLAVAHQWQVSSSSLGLLSSLPRLSVSSSFPPLRLPDVNVDVDIDSG